MIDTLRFGLVGAGYMVKTHSVALRSLSAFVGPSLPQIQLVRVADVSEKMAREGSTRWGWETYTTDWHEVTRADDIDVVVIVTPNNSHADISVDAFEHGKHVLCEKPLANTVESAARMTKSAAQSGKVNLVNYVYRCWPAIQLAKEIVEDGKLGDILHFEGHFFQDYAADPELAVGWRFDKSVSGGGAIGDIGSHIMDIACYLAGPVRRVAAQSRRFLQDRPLPDGSRIQVTVDDLTATLVEFENGATGSVHASWAATGHKTDIDFTLMGSKGAIKFNWEHNNELHFYDTADPKRLRGFRRIVLGGIHPAAEIFWYTPGQGLGYGEAFVITARRLVEAIVNGTAASPSFAEGLYISRVIDAVIRAAETKSWVDVSA